MLHYDYVSDEENGSVKNSRKWVVRCPAWRSEGAGVLMQRLQRQINHSQEEDVRPRVARVEGAFSNRPKPKFHIAWALVAEHKPTTPESERPEIT